MDIPGNFVVSDSDWRILRKLEDFVPEKVFDMHAHLYDTAHLPTLARPGSVFAEGDAVADRAYYTRFQCQLYPGLKRLRLNVVSVPDSLYTERANGHRARCNEFLIKHLEQNPNDVGEAFVLPEDTDGDIASLLGHPNIRGFKCYHFAAAKKPTWQAEIDEFLPESAWRAANEGNLCITLHMAKDRALADDGNIENIRDKVKKYPSAKLILAHAARGFAPWTALEGLKRLAQFDNVFFDVSAVCEPTAIFAVIKAAGADHVLWGSDFPVSMLRGKCVSIADSFLWLYLPMLMRLEPDTAAQANLSQANLVGVENLNALAQACDMLDLSRVEVENIFYHNAMGMFGLAD